MCIVYTRQALFAMYLVFTTQCCSMLLGNVTYVQHYEVQVDDFT